MGRPRTKNTGLPVNVHIKHGAYYYVRGGKWTRLAKYGDEVGMYKSLASLIQGTSRQPGMATLFDRYEREILPTKAPKTVINQRHQLDVLRRVFGKMEASAILPKHVAQYLDMREAKVAANREIALLSHVFRKAIRWGLAEKNPCTSVERNKETPSDRYIEDWEFYAVYQRASTHMQILMDLAYITGQRQGDILKIKLNDITDDGILFVQNKTGAKIIVEWSDALREVVNRAKNERFNRPSGVVMTMYLVVNAKGQKYTSDGVQTLWQNLIRDCIENNIIERRFTFRDIRAKARSDGEDKRLLGHSNPDAMAKTYQRKPVKVRPAR